MSSSSAAAQPPCWFHSSARSPRTFQPAASTRAARKSPSSKPSTVPMPASPEALRCAGVPAKRPKDTPRQEKPATGQQFAWAGFWVEQRSRRCANAIPLSAALAAEVKSGSGALGSADYHPVSAENAYAHFTKPLFELYASRIQYNWAQMPRTHPREVRVSCLSRKYPPNS